MTGDDAEDAIEDFRTVVPDDEMSFTLHVYLGALDKYETAAREAWAKALRVYRKRVSEVVVYDASPLIRMAAATVIAIVLRLPIRFESTKIS